MEYWFLYYYFYYIYAAPIVKLYSEALNNKVKVNEH